MKALILLLSATLIMSCGETKKQEDNTTKEDMMPVEPNGGIGDGTPSLDQAFVSSVEKAHKKEAFLNKAVVSFDIDLNFNGKDALDGTIRMLTNTSKIKIEHDNGSMLVFDNENVYKSPKDAEMPRARFSMFTWPYFFSLPYKLNDDGVNIEKQDMMPMEGESLEAFKMTFDAGTGDAPDDWYYVYTNDKQQIVAAGYIVTFGGTPEEEAVKNAHAIVYNDYKMVDGIPVATSWEFYNWSKEEGITGEPIGDATITNLTFSEEKEGMFAAPENSTIID